MGFQENDAYAVVLGKVVAHLRQKRQWSQGELGRRIGVQQSTISRIESGALIPDAFVFRRLADAFGMTPAEFQSGVEAVYLRTGQTAGGGQSLGGNTSPWWQVALGVAGLLGLAGLAAFSAAAVFNEIERDDVDGAV